MMSIYYPYRIAMTLLALAFMGGLCANLGYTTPDPFTALIFGFGLGVGTLTVTVGLLVGWKQRGEAAQPPLKRPPEK